MDSSRDVAVCNIKEPNTQNAAHVNTTTTQNTSQVKTQKNKPKRKEKAENTNLFLRQEGEKKFKAFGRVCLIVELSDCWEMFILSFKF